jgi:hypothetical protein
MQRFGDDSDGFSVASDKATGIVLVKAWGFWDPSIAGRFASCIEQECRTSGIPVR